MIILVKVYDAVYRQVKYNVVFAGIIQSTEIWYCDNEYYDWKKLQ